MVKLKIKVGLSVIQQYKIMPRFDGTGPLGFGPGTGWGMGPCGGGIGWGRRISRGFGNGYGWRSFLTKKEETETLKDEADILENELKAIKERLAELRTRK
jgi:hypothetical protein